MFDLGIQEPLVIFIVALIIFEPKRPPELGRALGKGLAELKRSRHDTKDQMDHAMAIIQKPLKYAPLHRARDVQERNRDGRADLQAPKIGNTTETVRSQTAAENRRKGNTSG